MPNFDVRDAYGSVITIESSVVGGANRQVVVATVTTGNSSVMLLSGANVVGSVATLQGTNPWIVRGSVSGTVDASLIGMLPGGTNVLGSVTALQGTNPWNISSIYGNISGSVVAVQGGTWSTSMVGAPVSSVGGTAAGGDRGVVTLGFRNDAIASTIGANLTYRAIATDSAGRTLTRPYATEESRIEGYASTVNLNATSVIAAAATGLRNYITDVWVANTGAAATLVTFLSGGGASILGYTIAPSGGGSNLPGLVTPMRTDAGATFDFRAATGTSVLYITAKGFTAP